MDHNEILHRPESQINRVPRCIVGDGNTECYTFVYTPDNDPVAKDIVLNLARSQNIPQSEIRAFANQILMDDFISSNHNLTQAAINFAFSSTSFDYSLQYNQTDQYSRGTKLNIEQYLVLPLQRAVDEEILRYASKNPALIYEPTTSDFVHPELAAMDVVAAAGPAFFVST